MVDDAPGGLEIKRRGLMLVLSSPSGAGKTSISRAVLERDANISLSISVTTRPRRPGEVDGEHYVFVDRTEFDLMVNRQELLEYAKVFDNYYGTPRGPVDDDLVSVFILPPSTAELERRLQSRAQDSHEVIADRMAKAADEITHWSEYDYVVVNESFEDSVAKVMAILDAERLRRPRQEGLSDLVRLLRQGQ